MEINFSSTLKVEFSIIRSFFMALDPYLGWVSNRLRTMAPAEIISRLQNIGENFALFVRLKHIQRRAWKKADNSNTSFKSQVRAGRLTDSISIQGLGKVIAVADQWRSHHASFLGLRGVPLGDPINWHRDYSSGFKGPLKYSPLINHRNHNKIGNIKYIWELNRLQHLVILAIAWSATGDRIYGDEIERQILSWTAKNPFMMGLNWKSPLEAGLRLISWAYLSFLTAHINQKNKIYHRGFRETIYHHQYFIKKFHSKYSSANNHLVGEMAGLYVGSIFWPWYDESAGWQSFARKKLIEEISRQVEVDGVGKERTTEYQLFIFELFLLAGALGHAVGDPFPRNYWERLRSMMTFFVTISDRSANFPMFGDGDSGKVLCFPDTTADRVHTLLQLGQSLINRTEEPDLRTFLLLWGGKTEKLPLSPVGRPKYNLQAYPQGGYYVLASDRGSKNEMVVVFDAGPIGFAPLYAHGHADALSFWLSYDGREFFIDPGTYCYTAPTAWRSYFRSTRAHNTLRIDRQDQSLTGGPFLWRHVAHCQAEHLKEHEDFVEVEGVHDGYRRLVDPVIHRRRMRLYKKSRRLVITDHLDCSGDHEIELFFHFNEKCEVKQAGPVCFQILNGNRQLILRFLDSQLIPKIYYGSKDPIFGWVSRTFDVKTPAFTLAARGKFTGSTQHVTEIEPG